MVQEEESTDIIARYRTTCQSPKIAPLRGDAHATTMSRLHTRESLRVRDMVPDARVRDLVAGYTLETVRYRVTDLSHKRE